MFKDELNDESFCNGASGAIPELRVEVVEPIQLQSAGGAIPELRVEKLGLHYEGYLSFDSTAGLYVLTEKPCKDGVLWNRFVDSEENKITFEMENLMEHSSKKMKIIIEIEEDDNGTKSC